MYLECRGTGSPTVVVVSGYGNHGGVWSLQSAELPQPPVLPAVAGFTRVCAYDRPGTIGDPDDPTDRSRSDPVPQPRAARETVADLHALLQAARVPGPYVLVGHSLGGLYARLYTATYPDEVTGMVLVDAMSERFRSVLTPEQWAASLELFDSPALLPQLASYGELERVDFDAIFDEMLQATAAQPLRRIPLAVLSAGVVPDVSELGLNLPPGFQETLAAAARANQSFQAALLPDARQVIVTEAGHYIQVEQPQAVIDAIGQVVTAVRDPASWPRAAVAGDFAGLVDIGGRRLYLECRGTGSPTVVLVSGYGNHGGIWSVQSEELPQPPVRPAVAGFTRVCAYDRPGTIGDADDPPDRSRSDAVPQPRAAQETVADLHALLHAAAVPGPYVLVGHSLGGLYSRLYASTYPDDVIGMVLVDATSEVLRAALTPAQWAFVSVLDAGAWNPELASYPELETVDLGVAYDATQQAEAAQPLRPLPLVVLSAMGPPGGPESVPNVPLGLSEAMAAAWPASQAFLARLVPDARQVVVPDTGHYIQLEQPPVVIDAIRQVVEAVRDPASWDELVSCCAR